MKNVDEYLTRDTWGLQYNPAKGSSDKDKLSAMGVNVEALERHDPYGRIPESSFETFKETVKNIRSIFDQGNSDTGCIGVCSTLFDAVCKGCGRTAYEVDNWVFLTPEEKEAARQRSRAFKEANKSE